MTKIIIGRAIFGFLFAAAGLWMLRVAFLAMRKRLEWKEGGVVVEGEVTGFEEVRSISNQVNQRTLYAPIVKFEDAGGTPRHFTSGQASYPNPYTVGQKISVRYMRLLPAQAEVDSASTGWFTVVAGVVMGLVFLGVSLLPVFLPMPKPR
jgi:hypothetical protein